MIIFAVLNIQVRMEDRTRKITSVTLWGAVSNVALAAAKLAAGVVGHSSAMVADAVHSISDLVSDVIVLVMIKVASKGTDKSHDYGHGKFETLASMAVSILLFVVGARLLASGIVQIGNVVHGGSIAVPGMIAFWAALVSIVVKEILFQWTARVARECESTAVLSNAWHHRTDALSSVASALGIGTAVLLGGRWAILDPIVCCGISIFIFVIAVRMAIPALNELTEGSLPEQTESEINELILSVEGVEDVHALKTRRSGPSIIVEAHLVVDPEMKVVDAHKLTVDAEKLVRERFGEDTQISFHIEPCADAD